MTDTLKPCPFCGDRLQRSYSERWIHSRPAKCILGDFYVYDDKVAAWNRRPPSQEAAIASQKTAIKCDECGGRGEVQVTCRNGDACSMKKEPHFMRCPSCRSSQTIKKVEDVCTDPVKDTGIPPAPEKPSGEGALYGMLKRPAPKECGECGGTGVLAKGAIGYRVPCPCRKEAA